MQKKNQNRLSIDFSNPLIIYLLVWILTLYLYSIEFTNNISGLNSSTNLLIWSSIVVFTTFYGIIYAIRFLLTRNLKNRLLNATKQNTELTILRFEKVINRIFKFWFIFTIFEIIFFKGIPLISVVVLHQYDLDYKAFGIPTLHGLLNACYYTSVVGFFILYRFKKENKYLKRVIIMLLWPILVMSRAAMLWVLVEILCVYFLMNLINLKKLFLIFSCIIGFVIIFGILGDTRGGEIDNFTTSTFVSEKYQGIAENIPTGFVWVYLYATTPINNIVLNVNNLKPQYSFKYSLVGLIPSFIRDKIYDETDKYSVELDDEAFNVSSFFANYMHDFGLIGAVIFVSVLQLISILFYFSAKTGKLGSIVSYSVLFYALFTSVFFDNFISLVTVFQIILGFYINFFVYKLKQPKYV